MRLKIFINRTYLLLLLGSLLVTTAYVTSRYIFRHQQIIIVFRYDDYSSGGETRIDNLVIETFKKYQIPLTIGVVPSPDSSFLANKPKISNPIIDKNNWDLLSTDKIEVAQHGFSHKSVIQNDVGIFSEFIGLERSQQYQKIIDGKNKLISRLDIEPTTFIPPWNSFDQNTLGAAENAGFRTFSADLQNIPPGLKSHLKFLPVTIENNDIMDAVRSARFTPDNSPIIAYLLHQYDFMGLRQTMTIEELDRLLLWVSQQDDIHPYTIQKLSYSQEDLGIDRYKSNTLEIRPYIFRFFRFYNPNIYLNSNSVNERKIISLVLSIVFYLTLATVSFNIFSFVGIYLERRNLRAIKLFRAGSLLIFIMIVLYVFRDMEIGDTGLIILMLSAGSLLGGWQLH